MLLCCFRDSSKDEKDDGPRSGRRHKYRDETGLAVAPVLTREDSSFSRLSASNEAGVILAPITFHPIPSNYESRPTTVMPPPPYKRSTSVCSNSDQQSLSRQSSHHSNSHYGLVRPHSRDGGQRRDKERAPLSKEAKRLFKQRSQESFVHDHARESVSSIPFIDQTPPTTKQIDPDDDKGRKRVFNFCNISY